MTKLPQPKSVWQHKKTERFYKVVMLTNARSIQPEKFPLTVVYADANDPETVWSRPATEFLENFSLHDAKKDEPLMVAASKSKTRIPLS